mgnify:CR=1 FL=1
MERDIGIGMERIVDIAFGVIIYVIAFYIGVRHERKRR